MKLSGFCPLYHTVLAQLALARPAAALESMRKALAFALSLACSPPR